MKCGSGTMLMTLSVLLTLLLFSVAWADGLDSPAAPTDAASSMYTLDDIYHRLNDGTLGAKRSGGFTMPVNPPGATGHTTDEIMAKAPVKDDTTSATADQVKQSKTFWGLRSSGWGILTGTMQDRTLAPGFGNYIIPAGYYAGGINLLTAEPNLVSANIAGGISLFGVPGTAGIINTSVSSGGATASDIVSGKSVWMNGALVNGSVVAKNSITGTNGQISFSIPDGYYSGKTASAQDSNLSAGNIASGVTIFGAAGTMGAASGNAIAANVLAGTTFSSASAGIGTTGTLPDLSGANYTPSTTNQSIAAGYHDGSGAVAGDANLVSTNIRSGVTIFGVSGNSNVVNTSTGTATTSDIAAGKVGIVSGSQVTGALVKSLTAPARVAKTGQTTSYTDGDDGHLGVGAGKVYPRFKDNGDGTVTDNLTGLIWLKNAVCFGGRTWTNALSDANTLANGECGLSDGSTAGQWRLPSKQELASLADYAFVNPAVPNTAGTAKWTEGDPFTSVQVYDYWSSTTMAVGTTVAWLVYLGADGGVFTNNKTGNEHYVWPVRDGQLQAGTPAPPPKTGQTGCWDVGGNSIACANTGQDGDLLKGVAWPNPRFTKNGDNTVTDNLTGLMWREDASAGANCGVDQVWQTWTNAMAGVQACNAAAYAGYADWRLPTVNELRSLIYDQYFNPAVPNTAGTGKWTAGDPFMNVQSSAYWSSTTHTVVTTNSWFVSLNYGYLSTVNKSNTFFVWPVRGGQ